MTCLNCKHNKILRGKENCKNFQFCLEQKNRNSPDYAKECEFYVPKTNADKIRSMTDEELAEWLEYEGGGACAEVCGWLDWLKQPAEGE